MDVFTATIFSVVSTASSSFVTPSPTLTMLSADESADIQIVDYEKSGGSGIGTYCVIA